MPNLFINADGSADKRMLTESLSLSRDILNYINRQVDEHEKEQRLFDIYNKLDARSSTIVNGKKFKVGIDGNEAKLEGENKRSKSRQDSAVYASGSCLLSFHALRQYMQLIIVDRRPNEVSHIVAR